MRPAGSPESPHAVDRQSGTLEFGDEKFQVTSLECGTEEVSPRMGEKDKDKDGRRGSGSSVPV